MKDLKLLGSLIDKEVYIALIQVDPYRSCFYFNDSKRQIAGLIEVYNPHRFQSQHDRGLDAYDTTWFVHFNRDLTNYSYHLWACCGDGGFSLSEANGLTKEDRHEQFLDLV